MGKCGQNVGTEGATATDNGSELLTFGEVAELLGAGMLTVISWVCTDPSRPRRPRAADTGRTTSPKFAFHARRSSGSRADID